MTLHPYSKTHKKNLDALSLPNTTHILISTTFHIPHQHLGLFAIFTSNFLHSSNYVLKTSQKCCTTSTLLHALCCLPKTHQHILIFYSDKHFSTYCTNTYTSAQLDLAVALTHCFDNLLTNEGLSFTGYWFSKAWVRAWTPEWQPLLKEAATMHTIHSLTPLMCSNEVQHEAYQKCILGCYYCTTVWGELSDIPARSAGPYIHVGQV
jgi:hypothetical protein